MVEEEREESGAVCDCVRVEVGELFRGNKPSSLERKKCLECL